MQTGQSRVPIGSTFPDVCPAAIHCAVLVIIITLDWLDLNMFSAFIDIVSRTDVSMVHAIRTRPDSDWACSSCLSRCKVIHDGGELMVTDLLP